jgi:serine phosphatase RsbU (regulator of sigma subunit)
MGPLKSNPTVMRSVIQWGVDTRAFAGEVESGDGHVVAFFDHGVLIAAIDGLGHGHEAAAAAKAAATVLHGYAAEPLEVLFKRCHEALRSTRGAVLSAASFDILNGTMSWLGVGNVTATLFRADKTRRPPYESILLRGGVVGYQLPPLRVAVLPIVPGDMLVLATDGIRDTFSLDLPFDRHPGDVAQDILRRFGTETDDALVLVTRYLGPSQ